MTVREIADFLNNLFERDSEAIHQLFSCRVQCNEATAYHPTVQVQTESDGRFTLGLVGLLNGLFGTKERVAGLWDNGQLMGFEVIKYDV